MIKLKNNVFNSEFKRNTILTYIKTAFALFFVFLFSFLILAYPKASLKGVNDGLSLCYNKLISALYPFMLISSFSLKSGLINLITTPFEKPCNFLFSLPKEALGVILMSFLGGYPVGAKMTGELYERNVLSRKSAKRLIYSSVNPSLSFTLSYIGAYLYKSEKAGLIILSSIISANLLFCFFFSRLKKESEFDYTYEKSKPYLKKLPEAFFESIRESTFSMLTICGTVVIFSCMLSILDFLIKSENLKAVLFSFLEVTNALDKYANSFSLTFICFIVSFGGICVHFQIMPQLLKLKIKYGKFILYKLIISLMSFAICSILLYFFPCEIATSINTKTDIAISKAGIPVSVCLFFMAIIIILTDSATRKLKNKA